MANSRAWQRAKAVLATAEDLTTTAVISAPTGQVGHTYASAAPAGWVFAAGRTIGSAASGATERANADTAALFALLWALDATLFPVTTSTGGASTRGASAAADFAANKRIQLPDHRGRVTAGVDNVGGAANRLTSAAGGVDATKLGSAGGAATHTLTTAQMPAHAHGVTDPGHNHSINDPGHAHTASDSGHGHGSRWQPTGGNYGVVASGGSYVGRVAITDDTNLDRDTSVNTANITVAAAGTGIWNSGNTTSISIQNNGSGQAHPNTQPTVCANPIIRL